LHASARIRIGRRGTIRRGVEKRSTGSEKEAIASLDALLRDAVKMRMSRTCPSGHFFPAGLIPPPSLR